MYIYIFACTWDRIIYTFACTCHHIFHSLMVPVYNLPAPHGGRGHSCYRGVPLTLVCPNCIRWHVQNKVAWDTSLGFLNAEFVEYIHIYRGPSFLGKDYDTLPASWLYPGAYTLLKVGRSQGTSNPPREDRSWQVESWFSPQNVCRLIWWVSRLSARNIRDADFLEFASSLELALFRWVATQQTGTLVHNHEWLLVCTAHFLKCSPCFLRHHCDVLWTGLSGSQRKWVLWKLYSPISSFTTTGAIQRMRGWSLWLCQLVSLLSVHGVSMVCSKRYPWCRSRYGMVAFSKAYVRTRWLPPCAV